jgi:hypothetical protein
VEQQEPEGVERSPVGRNVVKGKDFAWVVRQVVQVVGSSALLSAAEFYAASAIGADVVVELALAMAGVEQV